MTPDSSFAGETGGVVLRAMRRSDASSVAKLHCRAFPGFFLSVLGYNFLRHFYAAVAADPFGLAIVAEQEDRICGFVAGSAQPAGTYRRLLACRCIRLGISAIPALLRRPALIIRLVRSVAERTSSDVPNGTAELMSIGVEPSLQGRSIGTRLIEAFIRSAVEAGIARVTLTTDADDNAAANAFYVQRGFQLRRSFTTRERRHMNEYELSLQPTVAVAHRSSGKLSTPAASLHPASHPARSR